MRFARKPPGPGMSVARCGMSIPASLAPELEEVLQRGSSARRAETLKRIAILFAEGASRFNEDHIALFDEVLCQLSREADAGARVELSHRIAIIPNAPPKVLVELASDDDIAVAQPLLKQSARLPPPPPPLTTPTPR